MAAPFAAKLVGDAAAEVAAAKRSAELDAPSPAYLALNNLSAPSGATYGDATDMLGRGAHITPDTANYLTAWSTAAGYLSTVAGTSLGASMQARKVAFNLASESVLFAFRVKAAAPAANYPLMGNAGPGFQGVYLSARTNGKIRPVILTSTSDTSAVIVDSVATVCDGTDHDVVVAIDGPKGTVYLYIDGKLDSTFRNVFSGSTSSGAANWRFGNSQGSGATTIAASFYGRFHFLKWRGGLPFGLGLAAQKLRANPVYTLTERDFTQPTKSMLVAIGPGQSNEVGFGNQCASSGLYAAPQNDPLYAIPGRFGGVRSMWPDLANMLAQRGVWADFRNTAVGSTSIIHCWAGVLRAWANNMLVTRGTYVLAGGNIYKNVTGTKTAVTVDVSTAQPTGTAAEQTGGDSITWAYMGAARVQDVAGYIYPHTDAYFDPNGLFADMLTALNQGGYDEKWAFVSIGQGDKTMSTTRTEFALGYRRATDFFLANGIKVALGFTCYAGTSGAEAWYQSDLLPGYADALAFYHGNANVIPGANLRTALGVLSVGVSGDAVGLQGDALHLTNPALTLGAEAWRDALVIAGVV